ncbi:glycosyltransferase [Marinobacter adhaerens]|uniref:Glycosyltransferase n=1 Tax=Marinobacter adhaerens TaxID=1033846 RepID=A0A851HXX5_9GAMM|nr:glycosyltransferase [Marinobacter adhaerens]NWN91785.1 glycosyltransferase [Marinobacter adhaerens]
MNSRPAVVLVAPCAFHLGWIGATRRLFHVARAVEELGLQVVLVAGRTTNSSIQRPIDEAFPGRVFRTGHNGDYPPLIGESGFLQRAWRATWKLQGPSVYWSKLSWGWGTALDVGGLLSSFASLQLDIALVWGVSAGYLDGAVGAERLAKSLSVPWIFELHDPPRRAGLGPDQQQVLNKFSGLLENTNRIVVTAKSYAEYLGAEFGVSAEKLETIHLTYERLGTSVGGADDIFRLVYAGSLDGGRSLRNLLLALSQAMRTNPQMKDSLHIELAGSGPGFAELEALAKTLGVREQITFHGLLAGGELTGLLERASAVVVQENKSPLQVPGKVFESLALEKPVLGLMWPDCEAAALLMKAGVGLIHSVEDVKGIECTLNKLWESWRNGREIVRPDTAYINSFSTRQLPYKVRRVFDGLISVPCAMPAESSAKG